MDLIECAVCDDTKRGDRYGRYQLCAEHLEIARAIKFSPDNFQASVIVGGLRRKIRQDETWDRLMSKFSTGNDITNE